MFSVNDAAYEIGTSIVNIQQAHNNLLMAMDRVINVRMLQCIEANERWKLEAYKDLQALVKLMMF